MSCSMLSNQSSNRFAKRMWLRPAVRLFAIVAALGFGFSI